MDNNTETFGLDPESLARLWRLGPDSDQPVQPMDLEQCKADLLRDRLAERLPVTGASAIATSWQDPDEARSVLYSMGDEPIGSIIQNPMTDIDLLIRIKDHGRTMSESAQSDAEHHTANVIYFAAIARALVLHTEKISSLSWDRLSNAFSDLARKSWITSDLVELFQQAAGICCRSKTNGQERPSI